MAVIDPAVVSDLAARGLGSRMIAKRLGVTRHAVRMALASARPAAGGVIAPPKVGGESVGVTVDGRRATAVLPAGADLADMDALLRSRGLVPADWHVERVTANEWEALAYGGGLGGEPRVVTLHQLKVFLVARDAVLGPAVEVSERHRPDPGTSVPAGGLVCVLGDQQAPYHDPVLHRAVLRWLADVQPQVLVLTGDTMDFPTISRHRDRLRWSASAQECVDTAYRLVSDYVDAWPGARRFKLRGNHDIRLETEIMQRAERMAFLTPAERDGNRETYLYSVRRLLHLDSLGVELVGTEGDDWRFGELAVAPGLSVRHEPPSLAKAARLRRSVMAGHTHRQSIKYLTAFGDGDDPAVQAVVEVGCLAQTREGLGYAEHPDWQPGFGTAVVGEDGAHHFELATWRGGVLSWRGERWSGS